MKSWYYRFYGRLTTMMCPLDNQPCTGLKDDKCYNSCIDRITPKSISEYDRGYSRGWQDAFAASLQIDKDHEELLLEEAKGKGWLYIIENGEPVTAQFGDRPTHILVEIEETWD